MKGDYAMDFMRKGRARGIAALLCLLLLCLPLTAWMEDETTLPTDEPGTEETMPPEGEEEAPDPDAGEDDNTETLSSAGSGMEPTVAYVVNPEAVERLNLREEASASSKSLGMFYTGTVVEVLGTSGEYTQVRVGEQEGYMQSTYLSSTRDALDLGFWATVNIGKPGQTLHLRASTEEGANSLGMFPNGYVVQVLGDIDPFYRVRTLSMEAFMLKQYLQVDGQVGREKMTTLTLGKVIASESTLYSFPDREGVALSRLANGDTVTILDTVGVWYYVEISGPNGWDIEKQRGFIPGIDLQVGNYNAQTGSNPTTYAVVRNPKEDGLLVLRAEAMWSSDIVMTLINETQMQVLDTVDFDAARQTWWHVRVGSLEGYVLSEHVMEIEKGPTTEW